MVNKAVTRPCVLLVEDDKLTRTVLRHDLKLHGFDVDIAENGDVALKKLQRESKGYKQIYDLVLTDVFMPKVNGESLVQAVRNSELKHVPIVGFAKVSVSVWDAVMSANCEDKDKARFLSLGAAQYLVKPIRRESLVELRALVAASAAYQMRDNRALPADRDICLGANKSSQSPNSQSTLAIHVSKSIDSPTQPKEAHSLLVPGPLGRTANEPPGDLSTSSEMTGVSEVEGRKNISCSGATGRHSPGGHPELGASACLASMTPSPFAIQLCTSQVDAGNSGRMVNLAVMMPCEMRRVPSPSHQCTKQNRVLEELQSVQGNTGISQNSGSQKRGSAQSSKTMKAPTYMTFISSATNLAPLDSRKAALARFREKKARSHFAPKVRYHERKKLAEARPRYKGQFVRVDQIPKEHAMAEPFAVIKPAPGTVKAQDSKSVPQQQ